MPARDVSGVTLGQFFAQVLKGLGVPVTTNNLTKLGAVATMEGHGGDYNPFNSMGGSQYPKFNVQGVKSYPDIATGVAMTVKLLSQQNTSAMRASLQSDGPYNGWMQAVQRFYTWGGYQNIPEKNALTKLQGQIDGPKVTDTSWLSAPSGSGTSFDVGAGQAKTSYDPADPLGWKQIAAGMAAPTYAPGGTAADPLGWAGIQKWQQGQEGIFNAWLKTQPADKQTEIVQGIQGAQNLTDISKLEQTYGQGVTDFYDYLARLPGDQANAAVAKLTTQDAGAMSAAAPEHSTAISDLLGTFGVSYPNSPEPTPALLAFLNGIGLNLSTAEDVKKRALERIGTATSDAMVDIDRTAGRTKQNITADLIRRNILSSGESNTRYARQAEDVAKSKADVERTSASSSATISDTYEQARNLAKQQALDRVIGAEQDQATQKATSEASTTAMKAQQDAADLSWQRQQAAQQEANKASIDAINQAAARGVAL